MTINTNWEPKSKTMVSGLRDERIVRWGTGRVERVSTQSDSGRVDRVEKGMTEREARPSDQGERSLGSILDGDHGYSLQFDPCLSQLYRHDPSNNQILSFRIR